MGARGGGREINSFLVVCFQKFWDGSMKKGTWGLVVWKWE